MISSESTQFDGFWDRPLGMTGARCTMGPCHPLFNSAANAGSFLPFTEGDCFECADPNKVLDSFSVDPNVTCVEWKNYSSCDLGYQTDNF
jgi:hypothetical protein